MGRVVNTHLSLMLEYLIMKGVNTLGNQHLLNPDHAQPTLWANSVSPMRGTEHASIPHQFRPLPDRCETARPKSLTFTKVWRALMTSVDMCSRARAFTAGRVCLREKRVQGEEKCVGIAFSTLSVSHVVATAFSV